MRNIIAPGSCVYFVFNGSELIYIGQTKNIVLRFNTHHITGFTHIRYIMTEERHHYEKRFINYFKPKYNIAGGNEKVNPLLKSNRRTVYFSDNKVWEELKKLSEIEKCSINNILERLATEETQIKSSTK